MSVVEFKPKEPRAPATLQDLFDSARRDMLAAWTALAASGTHDRQGLVDEMCGTLRAMRGIAHTTTTTTENAQ